MPLLSASHGNVTELAPALPIRNRVFNALRLYLRQGQFTILAAAPSVGKSVFARNLAAFTPAQTLFFSADSDEYTVSVGMAAALTAQELRVVEDQIQNPQWGEYYAEQWKRVDHIDFCFRTDLNIDFLERRVAAHAELFGNYPELVVIDNLSDMVTEEGPEVYAELRAICRKLREIARLTKSHILALHHLTGEYEDGMKPVTLKALEGKVGKVPENVLGLHWTDASQQNVTMTVPKARGTKRGALVNINIDYSKALIGDFQ